MSERRQTPWRRRQRNRLSGWSWSVVMFGAPSAPDVQDDFWFVCLFVWSVFVVMCRDCCHHVDEVIVSVESVFMLFVRCVYEGKCKELNSMFFWRWTAEVWGISGDSGVVCLWPWGQRMSVFTKIGIIICQLYLFFVCISYLLSQVQWFFLSLGYERYFVAFVDFVQLLIFNISMTQI